MGERPVPEIMAAASGARAVGVEGGGPVLFLCTWGFFNQNPYHFSSNRFLSKMLSFYINASEPEWS